MISYNVYVVKNHPCITLNVDTACAIGAAAAGDLTVVDDNVSARADAQSLTAKIRSIQGFKGIKTPMTKHPDGWQPNLTSRYFQEDFMHGLRYIYDTAHKMGVETPTIDRIYKWGEALAQKGRK